MPVGSRTEICFAADAVLVFPRKKIYTTDGGIACALRADIENIVAERVAAEKPRSDGVPEGVIRQITDAGRLLLLQCHAAVCRGGEIPWPIPQVLKHLDRWRRA
jgi:hypothetical protein